MPTFECILCKTFALTLHSEGVALSHDDAKTYWGNIERVPTDDDDKEHKKEDKEGFTRRHVRPIEVQGTVFTGGLSSEPIGKFTMMEKMEQPGDKNIEDIDEDSDDSANLEGFHSSDAFQ